MTKFDELSHDHVPILRCNNCMLLSSKYTINILTYIADIPIKDFVVVSAIVILTVSFPYLD